MRKRSLNSVLMCLERLNAIGAGLSAGRNIELLLEEILLGAKEITGADGGTLYRMTGDGRLRFEILRTDSLGFAMGGSSKMPIPFEPISLYNADGQPMLGNVVTRAALTGEAINIPDKDAATEFDFSGTRAFDQRTGYHSRSFLTVPMKNHEGLVIGVLQLLNALDPDTGEIVPFQEEDQQLVSSLASQASLVLTKNQLIDELRHLFEALIRIIATAVDQKSPYTGGHCRRVPILTMLLADAAHACNEGPLRDFVLDPDHRYELEMAAWLHDCGKITVPEYVVDKATKLQTVFDRMELIETRFEILRRDSLIAQMRHKTSGDLEQPQQPSFIDHEQMADDLAFLRRCNTGSEGLASSDQQRLAQIASVYRWQDAQGVWRSAVTGDELENLSIFRGTLNPAEVRIVNSHVTATLSMLQGLPLPATLRQMPQIAASHHERLDGKGYPRGLAGGEISMQARILAIADVFEALTACDRPYKKGKTPTEALDIMQSMVNSGHIDGNLLDVFIGKGIHELYAEQYLTTPISVPEQACR